MLDYNFITHDENIKVKEIITSKKTIFDCEDLTSHHCPKCGSYNLRCKDTYQRNIKWISVEGRATIMRISTHKYCCKECGKYFNSLPKGLLKHQRTSEFIKREVFRSHCQGVSKKDLSDNFDSSDSSIERWFKDGYRKKNRELKSATCPRVLGIDEHYFSKKRRYATTFVNLSKHKVFDIVLGRKESELVPYLASLKGKDKVRVVVMDLSSNYHSIVRKYFPNAMIVSDRFHVVRLALDCFIKTCYQLDSNLKKKFKFGRLLRKKFSNLSNWEKEKLAQYFTEQPKIKVLYDFMQNLMLLLNQKAASYKKCKKKLVPQLLKFIEMLKESGFEMFKKLGKTMETWQSEIGRMFRFTKTNGITEGFHRKMKLIQRRAYGFRNFENYRLRVRILCG